MNLFFTLAIEPATGSQSGSLDYVPLRLGVTIVLILVFLARSIFPKLNFDATGLALLVLAMFPWLAPFVSHFEIFGLKADVPQRQIQKITNTEILRIEKKVDDALKEAQFATNLALNVVHSPAPSASVAPSAGASPSTTASPSASASSPEQRIADLVAQYKNIRNKPGGASRTAEMNNVVSQMIPIISKLRDFKPSVALASKDEGDHLRAVVYMYAMPSFEDLSVLVKNVTAEEDPFIQYWGIQAIGSILASSSQLPSETQKRELRQLLAAVDNTNDQSRYNALKRFIAPFVPTVHIETQSGNVTTDAKKALQALKQSGYMLPDYERPIDFDPTKEDTIYYNASNEQASVDVEKILKDAGLGSLKRSADTRLPIGELYVYFPND